MAQSHKETSPRMSYRSNPSAPRHDTYTPSAQHLPHAHPHAQKPERAQPRNDRQHEDDDARDQALVEEADDFPRALPIRLQRRYALGAQARGRPRRQRGVQFRRRRGRRGVRRPRHGEQRGVVAWVRRRGVVQGRGRADEERGRDVVRVRGVRGHELREVLGRREVGEEVCGQQGVAVVGEVDGVVEAADRVDDEDGLGEFLGDEFGFSGFVSAGGSLRGGKFEVGVVTDRSLTVTSVPWSPERMTLVPCSARSSRDNTSCESPLLGFAAWPLAFAAPLMTAGAERNFVKCETAASVKSFMRNSFTSTTSGA